MGQPKRGGLKHSNTHGEKKVACRAQLATMRSIDAGEGSKGAARAPAWPAMRYADIVVGERRRRGDGFTWMLFAWTPRLVGTLIWSGVAAMYLLGAVWAFQQGKPAFLPCLLAAGFCAAIARESWRPHSSNLGRRGNLDADAAGASQSPHAAASRYGDGVPRYSFSDMSDDLYAFYSIVCESIFEKHEGDARLQGLIAIDICRLLDLTMEEGAMMHVAEAFWLRGEGEPVFQRLGMRLSDRCWEIQKRGGGNTLDDWRTGCLLCAFVRGAVGEDPQGYMFRTPALFGVADEAVKAVVRKHLPDLA